LASNESPQMTHFTVIVFRNDVCLVFGVNGLGKVIVWYGNLFIMGN